MDNGTYERLLEIEMVEVDKIKQVINTTSIETPLGTMLVGATEQGICLLEYTDGDRLNTEFNDLARLLNATIQAGENKHFAPLQKQLSEYFEGGRKTFDVPIIICGTSFQQEVWRELQNIPYGVTRSYKEQSIALNKLDAIRAVASANGANRIAIIIPCHRVIGNNGSLTGYGGGLWRKKWLLDLEKGQLTLPSR
jgi:AraC family transcriptional regulator of adaptative response/methylated-DNA-[protein]-cysteine methyltransferase